MLEPDKLKSAGEAMRKHIGESYRRYAEQIFRDGHAPAHPALQPAG